MTNDQPAMSRREAREARDAASQPAEDTTDVLAATSDGDEDHSTVALKTEADAAEPTVGAVSEADAKKAKKRRRRRRGWWIFGISFVLLVAIALGGAYVAKRLYDQAMGVRGHLEASIAAVTEARAAVFAVDLEGAKAATATLQQEADAAVAGTQGRLWTFAEDLPWIGNNLKAVTSVAEITQQLTNEVVVPASSVSLDTLLPKDGRIDVQALAALVPLIDQITEGVNSASEAVDNIDRTDLIDEISAGVDRLDSQLGDIGPAVKPIRDILAVLPDALGASGPRNYLMMFQGNSEARSLGGNAAVFVILHAENGALTITDEISSQDFNNAPPEPILALDPEAENIYGDKIGRYTADFTMVPDFPEAVRILSAWWEREGFPPYDAVISFDPVALSYLLGVTGPVTLIDGDQLTADNAAALLLNQVYFEYSDPYEQNAYFESAASNVFAKLTSGAYPPLGMISALTRAVDERRLMYWSADPEEMALVAPTPMAGTFPADNTTTSAFGFFVNDNTTSKKSYYLDAAISVCRTETGANLSATLSSSLTEEQAAGLPFYTVGRFFPRGTVSSYVTLYGPVGTTISSVTLDGRAANILSAGQHLGRPAVKVEILNQFVSSHTIAMSVDGLAADAGPISVIHTPMSRETAVAASETCG